MIQIAHIIRQLVENGIKEISQQIKKALISNIITNLKVHKKVQLRFD